MLPKQNRLRRNRDVNHVRRLGKVWRHPLLVLYTVPNGLESSRFAIAAGRHIGNAVVRNRCRRRIREMLRQQLCEIQAGWDCLIVARHGMATAAYAEIERAMQQLLWRSGLAPVAA